MLGQDSIALKIEPSEISVAPEISVIANVVIDPIPDRGLFSASFLVRLRGDRMVGLAQVQVVDELKFNGPLESRSDGIEGVGWSAGRGTVDFFSPSKDFYDDGILGRLSLDGLPSGEYLLELESFPIIGVPGETLFVDGESNSLDPRMRYGSARVSVGFSSPIEVGDILLDRQTGLFRQVVRLTDRFFEQGLEYRIYVFGLPEAAALWNGDGVENGVPYVIFSHGEQGPESREKLLEYHFPKREVPEGISVRVESQPSGVVQSNLRIHGEFRSDPLGFAVEFESEPDRIYRIEYSSDLREWRMVDVKIIGSGSKVQWIDIGPPLTDCRPQDCRQRFYRVLEGS